MALSPVEHLIACLFIVERDRGSGQRVIEYMTAAGFSKAEIQKAWLDADRAGLTRDSGIGARLSSAGRAEAPEFAAQLERQPKGGQPDPPSKGTEKFAIGLAIEALLDRSSSSPISASLSEMWCVFSASSWTL